MNTYNFLIIYIITLDIATWHNLWREPASRGVMGRGRERSSPLPDYAFLT